MRFLYRILLISVLVIASSKQANSLKIVHFAVGKGDATLIISPTNQTLMIDAGSETYGGAEAADRIYSYMAEHCIEYLTYTIITHSHDDHLNAFPVLFEDYNILPIIAFDRGAPGIDTLWYNCSSYHHYIDLVESYAIRDSITAGHVIDLGGGVTVTAIYSNGNFSNGRSDYLRDIHSMENVRSMCLLLEYENFRYVIAGDITGKGGVYSDKETPSAGIIGDVDVFQVNHHGGGSSTNQNWLDLLRPEAGVLSADSLMAKQDVLDRIDACPSMISLYHTGLSYNSGVKSKMVNGNVILETDGLTFYKIVSDTFAIAEESPLSVSIYPDPDYVVIPAEGGSFDCLLEISNSGTEELQFDCWTRWHHDGNWRTGSGPADLTVQAGETLRIDLTVELDSIYTLGNYAYEARVGIAPDEIWDSHSIPVWKDSLGGGYTSGHEYSDLHQQLSGFEVTIGVLPNPFNPTATISYSINTACLISLQIYDIWGRTVATLVEDWQEAGSYTAAFSGKHLSSGVYLYRFKAGKVDKTGKLLLIR